MEDSAKHFTNHLFDLGVGKFFILILIRTPASIDIENLLAGDLYLGYLLFTHWFYGNMREILLVNVQSVVQ